MSKTEKQKIEELEASFTNMMDKMDHFEKTTKRVPEAHRFATELIGRVMIHQAMCDYMNKHRAVFGEESSNG